MRTVETSGGLWAPTIRYFKGKWLRVDGDKPDMIPPTGFYVVTDDIFDDTKWSDATYFEEQGFDQDLLFDDDDRVYLTTTRFEFSEKEAQGFRIISYSNEIDIRTGTSLTRPNLTKDSSLGTAEGCHIIKREGLYYLFTAEGGTQNHHQEWVYRSSHPLGPWEAPPAGVNPVIFNGDHPDIQNTGHMDLIEGKEGQWWAVFLGVRPVFAKAQEHGVDLMPTHLGRETFLAPLEWIDDWPVVNGRKPVELIGEARGLSLVPEFPTWIDNFDSDKLQLGWYHIRTPLRQIYSLTERPGSIAIRGSAYRIDQDESPAALLRKQPGLNMDFSTEVEFTPTEIGEQAGAVVFMEKKSFASVAIQGVENGKVGLVFKSPSGNGQFTVSPSAVTLRIKARTLSYEFSFKQAGSESFIVAGTVSTDSFKPLFTGIQVGIYAQGNVTPCLSSAYFTYARFDPPEDL
ncbi:hypothetical protein QFC22_006703 [Naganishia vaughanmartiniae]|uniref:Uncharacterized protein n=1 Tax=Naganishia vaughanmartiniae TaxID=1424756 RepID=A0ACC2WFR6_9TREE|nr:hypothetical protein QFC22_006703 [Naganishia vaughanmartiniae]